MSDPDAPRYESDVERRQREGAQRGADLVRAEFAAVLTRRRYCELVGIHATTLRRWEQAGVLKPRREEVMGISTTVFDTTDVRFGKRLVQVIREHAGKLSVSQAAELVRRSSS